MKQLKFINNECGPYAKRRRISSACHTCRRRKTRCSGERPHCQTCASGRQQCEGYSLEADRPARMSPPAEELAGKADPLAEARSPPPDNNTPLAAKKQSAKRARSPAHDVHPGPDPHPRANLAEHKPATVASSGRPLLSLSTRNRMPYFRYFGPTAIMPGFKQMVVKVRNRQHSGGATSSDAIESPSTAMASIGQVTPPQGTATDVRTPVEIPLYDNSSVPPSPLIIHLCKTFFVHLGCNFPFLQEERFMRDLEEKQVDAILVDAVCAMAARFSNRPLLAGVGANPQAQRVVPTMSPSEYGQAFAQRAKAAIIDTFACPSVAVVQAALLLAYDEFGANRDSGLWMYLGIAIRMAQDLGMQKIEGLKFEGRGGPTPKTVKSLQSPGVTDELHQPQDGADVASKNEAEGTQSKSEQRAVERERVDTFWSVFFLDRVISSGTGRPVTLRDRDIEISFPSLDEVDPRTGWPNPFPALIRIIHLYGRVTDLLNGIKAFSHVTPDVLKRLAIMESHLTDIYQGLSARLHFNAVNFQHYVKARQGTTFVLLHFWFHTLIVLLHQPTLLHTFEGRIQQLFGNSRELSMSSAKTIADILSFAELTDAKSSLGNPFTSQPIYIAACAFLKEAALYSASSNPQSRDTTPLEDKDRSGSVADGSAEFAACVSSKLSKASMDQKQAAKCTLLASAANQNYQRCYRAIQSLETYWAGVKYILTVLDQKSKGVGDPLLYTREEMESALEVPKPEPSFTSPGWRRKVPRGTYVPAQEGDSDGVAQGKAMKTEMSSNSPPMMDPNQVIGWSLTGTMNSPSTSLAVMYPTDPRDRRNKRLSQGKQRSIPQSNFPVSTQRTQGNSLDNTASSAFPKSASVMPSGSNMKSPTAPSNTNSSMPPPSTVSTAQGTMRTPASDPALVSDADLLLNLHSPFPSCSPRLPNTPINGGGASYSASSSYPQPFAIPEASSISASPVAQSLGNNSGQAQLSHSHFPDPAMFPFGDMLIESQDIDVSALGDDMMPWLEYLPHDMLSLLEQGGNSTLTTEANQQSAEIVGGTDASGPATSTSPGHPGQ
ncbi:fungal-specific transcription factor domain-containing protein [Lineolata rhizophorae]|uniref:Fungal-specific transcription factor domain-containing protein n=1 Tax=Lineolata rhizophorae TaxID=578093 RepID=A0A6A6PE28_9PEZI|nr:fungal-specific transcription factor domain-containing protein [Lineolata rhizophorae]